MTKAIVSLYSKRNAISSNKPLLLMVLILFNTINVSITLSDEKKLIKHLLHQYEQNGIIGRPVQNSTEKVIVSYGLGLIQILDLDEKNQILTVNVWSRYTWQDKLLQWDPRLFNNVTEVRIPPELIWTPDIVLYNYADERLKEQREVMLVVQSNGDIMWIPPAIYKSTCKIDIKNFPFDHQACFLKFGSWTYDGFKLDIQFYGNRAEVNTDDYIPSKEWAVLKQPAIRNVKYYPCCAEPYPDLTFFLLLRRNPAFYAYLLVLPCVLLSSLTLVIFWLPPESPAKMVLGMNIFVAFFLLLLLLADSTPSASTSVPYLGYYYCLNMILITTSSFLSVFVINLYFRGDKKNRIPRWLRKVAEFLAGLLCMQQVVVADEAEKVRLVKAEIKHNKNHNDKMQRRMKQFQQVQMRSTMQPYHMQNPVEETVLVPQPGKSMFYQPPGGASNQQLRRPYCQQPSNLCNKPHIALHQEDHERSRRDSSSKSPLNISETLEPDLHEIRRTIRTLILKLADQDAAGKILREWRMVALVLDRIFFCCYLCVIIIAGFALLLPKDPSKSLNETIEEYTFQAVERVTVVPEQMEQLIR